jgi:hypothetical protein
VKFTDDSGPTSLGLFVSGDVLADDIDKAALANLTSATCFAQLLSGLFEGDDLVPNGASASFHVDGQGEAADHLGCFTSCEPRVVAEPPSELGLLSFGPF